jgi:ubiquinone/menaquinone biosynthesis C-methylase UbiE
MSHMASHPDSAGSPHDVEAASRAHFDRWRRAYALAPLARLQRMALESLELGQGDRLLDVACGLGGAVATASHVVERAVGVDISPQSIAAARAEIGDRPNVELQAAPSDALPFEDGEFTALLCSTAVHHFPDPARSLSEARRVLAPRGRIVLADLCADSVPIRAMDIALRRFEQGHVGCLSSAEVEALLTGSGFAAPRLRRVRGGLYFIACAEAADSRF